MAVCPYPCDGLGCLYPPEAIAMVTNYSMYAIVAEGFIFRKHSKANSSTGTTWTSTLTAMIVRLAIAVIAARFLEDGNGKEGGNKVSSRS